MTAQLALEVRRLGVAFGDAVVVADLDLDVRQGEWLGLIGPNGAGKTSLLRALAGLASHQGSVRTHSGTRPGPKDLAMVQQEPVRPSGMTVAEYVLLGRTAYLGWLARESRADRIKVAQVLARLDLLAFAERSLVSLSGGEFQRAVLGRALAQETPILLLDEPTSALDVGHQVTVLELVDDLRRSDGLTVVAVMHDLTTAARFADRLALLDHGRLIALGSPDEVAKPELLSATYRAPLTVRRIDGELVVLPAPRSPHPNS